MLHRPASFRKFGQLRLLLLLPFHRNIYGFITITRQIYHSSTRRYTSSKEGKDPNNDDATFFDVAAYEKDRLEKDALAMNAMQEIATNEFAKLRTPWKWTIRKRIWDMMEEKDIARYPRPVHHRIPNFVGADVAARLLTTLPEYRHAKCVKVNPDTPQRPVRHAVLNDGKLLLTPQPRLRTGFFSKLDMAELNNRLASPVKVEDCTTSKGVAQYGTPVTLNDQSYTVDLVVVGSTAVCPTTGARVGKGEGFAELEWGILSAQANLNPFTTLVVTTVHDEQVVPDMMRSSEVDAAALTKHDVPVDIIVTPTRIIRVSNRLPKPTGGIFWDLLSPQKLAQIRVLRQLKEEIEKQTGQSLPSGPDEVLPPVAQQQQQRSASHNKNNNNTSATPPVERSRKQQYWRPGRNPSSGSS
jgi:5-formyltetrahydrofolate cyclo-ligase